MFFDGFSMAGPRGWSGRPPPGAQTTHVAPVRSRLRGLAQAFLVLVRSRLRGLGAGAFSPPGARTSLFCACAFSPPGAQTGTMRSLSAWQPGSLQTHSPSKKPGAENQTLNLAEFSVNSTVLVEFSGI